MPSLKNTPSSPPNARTQPANPRHTKRPQSHFRTLWDRPPGLSSGSACSPPMSANRQRISAFNIDPLLPQPHFLRISKRSQSHFQTLRTTGLLACRLHSPCCQSPVQMRLPERANASSLLIHSAQGNRCQHRDTLGSRRDMLPSRHTVTMPPIRILTISEVKEATCRH
jgi:hypothetical protein